MIVKKVLDSTVIRGGKVYLAETESSLAVFFDDVNPEGHNLALHPYSVFRTYDEAVAKSIFASWKANRI